MSSSPVVERGRTTQLGIFKVNMAGFGTSARSRQLIK
jgi:hypothetical protein